MFGTSPIRIPHAGDMNGTKNGSDAKLVVSSCIHSDYHFLTDTEGASEPSPSLSYRFSLMGLPPTLRQNRFLSSYQGKAYKKRPFKNGCWLTDCLLLNV